MAEHSYQCGDLCCFHSSFKSGYGVYQRNHSHDLHDIVLACL